MSTKAEIFAAFSLLSAISSLVLFGIVYKTLWETAGRNVMWMSIADFMVAVVVAISYFRTIVGAPEEADDSTYCRVTGFFITQSSCAAVLWYAMLAVNLILSLQGKDNRYILNQSWWQHLVAWGYSLTVAAIALGTDTFRIVEDHYCWLKSPRDPLRFIAVYAPVFVSICLSLGLFIYVTALYFVQTGSRFRDSATLLDHPTLPQQLVVRVYSFLTLFCLCWIFPLSGRISDAVEDSNDSPFDKFLPGLLGFTGLSNLVVWALASPTLWTKCRSYRICRCSQDPLDSTFASIQSVDGSELLTTHS